MSKKIILCVDDDATVLSALRTLLGNSLGSNVVIEMAESGQEALEVCADLQHDGDELAVVITDFIMPNMNGDELLVALHQFCPHTIKIMLTGQSDLAGIKRAINDANLYRFLEKPFDNADMVLTVKSALRAYNQDRELRQRNAELVDINRNLGRLVDERTAELQEKNRELERLSAAKSALVATVSHEIRTPMNGILGMLKLLQHTDMTLRQLDYARKAEGATQNLLSIINAVLDFSKVDAGKMVLEQTRFNLSDLLHELSAVSSSHQGAGQAELLFDVALDVPPVLLGDELRLRQVLLNLTGNALKFTPQGEVVLGIRLRNRQGQRAELEFSVCDTGIGIPADRLNFIFEGFSQADAATTRHFGGTGLGLVISKQLVALMGGSLQVQSVPGQGSRFFFCLSLDVASGEAVNPPGPPGGAVRVLIVDDNATARTVMMGMVQSLQWHGDCAASGPQALLMLDRAEAADYDAVLLDWQMPGLDGWQTAQRLAALRQGRPVPVVMMVTVAGREQLATEIGEQAGLVGSYLIKPATAGTLCTAVSSALAGRGQHQDSALQLGWQGSQCLRGLRILVVDDNPLNQQVAQELLQACAAEVWLADSGLTAIAQALAADPPFDAILMDMRMPDIDGLEATRRMRSHAQLRDVAIIAVTGSVMEADKQACRTAGMNDHVSKPMELAQLIGTVLRHTRPAAGGESAPQTAVQGDVPLAQTPVLDVAQALQRLGDDRALYARVVTSFRAESRKLIGSCQRALEQGRGDDTLRCLHTLSGLAGMVGAERLQCAAAQAEATLQTLPGFLTTGSASQAGACVQGVAAQLELALLRLGEPAYV